MLPRLSSRRQEFERRIALVARERGTTVARLRPPIYTFTFPQPWRATLVELARNSNYETDDISIIETQFNSYLTRLTETI